VTGKRCLARPCGSAYISDYLVSTD
jgi:hypothetical protein